MPGSLFLIKLQVDVFIERYILHYFPLAIMKKFVQLMLHFSCLSSPEQLVDIFRHSLPSRWMVVLFVNVCER